MGQQRWVGLAHKVRHLLGIDRAIGFTVLARGWTILSGALTLLLIARYLNVTEQGYYYTFSSLVSIQVVFELGFSFVILQLAAHEISLLSVGPSGVVSGDPAVHSRLASILQKSVRWYSVAAVLMGVVLLFVGFHFFSAHSASSVGWRIPWICIVCAAVLTFQMDPIFSFLEGCGFVAQVARMRLTQAISGTVLAWLLLTQHRGLFAPAAVISGQAAAGFAFLLSKRRFLLPLLRRECRADFVGWRTEIWPFQWRMAVTFSCSYFIFPLFNPVLFAYRGAAEAGRMGMSLTIAMSLGTVAFAWINTKASPFGTMIGRRDFVTLDRVFFRTLLQSGALLLAGEAVVLCGIFAIERKIPHLAQRMLPLPILAVLMLAIFLNHVLYSEALYLRAHKREPFLVLSIVVALICCASTLVAGRWWGTTGVTVGYFVCGGVINLAGGTYIFMRSRRIWHSKPDAREG